MTDKEVRELEKIALQTRKDAFEMGLHSGHIGPALSCTDILVALYYKFLRVRPDDPHWADRDRFVLSKGHACSALYSVLARKGFFDVAELKTAKTIGSMLQGHPDMKKTPGVDMTSGSLGNGMPIALGMALALRAQNRPSKVVTVIGDGETQEGMIWEAAMTAPAKGVDNFIVILDHNHYQSGSHLKYVVPLYPLREKWESFGWNVLEANGHDFRDLSSKLEISYNFCGHPTIIIAHTIKGKGISFVEHDPSWHGRPPTQDEYARGMAELDATEKALNEPLC